MNTQWFKPAVCRKCSSKWLVYSNTSPPLEIGKISNKQPNLIPKTMR